MAVATKICGLTSPAAVAAAIAGKAQFVGAVFYPPSPRSLAPAAAGDLLAPVPHDIRKVGVFVDPDDAQLATAVATAGLDIVQLHGAETPARVAAIKARTGRPVMKAIKVRSAPDLAAAAPFEAVADWLLFDAWPPGDTPATLPGGNALSFDWRLLTGRAWRRPWFLAGGIDPDNLREAVTISGARFVDVSSGVERVPGDKDPAKIAAFLDIAARL